MEWTTGKSHTAGSTSIYFGSKEATGTGYDLAIRIVHVGDRMGMLVRVKVSCGGVRSLHSNFLPSFPFFLLSSTGKQGGEEVRPSTEPIESAT